ncbi:MAG: hypothetical protein LBF85_10060 [Tannerella sp.]|jgi:hypothetical protein|nr:hypothetical protein [Tannerella sp.]
MGKANYLLLSSGATAFHTLAHNGRTKVTVTVIRRGVFSTAEVRHDPPAAVSDTAVDGVCENPGGRRIFSVICKRNRAARIALRSDGIDVKRQAEVYPLSMISSFFLFSIYKSNIKI